MGNKFNPEDLKNPLYEYSQVITLHDLRVIYANLAKEYKNIQWWQIRLKFNCLLASQIVYELMTWLSEGKPVIKKELDK